MADPNVGLPCASCNSLPLQGIWRQVRARVAYWVLMTLPVPRKRRLYGRAYFAVLPFAGEWAFSCHCARTAITKATEKRHG